MKIFCAYTNPSDATLISLQPYIDQSTFIDCSDDKWAYVKHFQSIWDQGETAVNLEHDICFWPGAIESLIACPRAFCWFDDQWALKASRKNYARFGLVKLSAYLISQTKDVWKIFCAGMNRSIPVTVEHVRHVLLRLRQRPY